jgi:dipeptidyl-peptidase-4
MPATPPAPLTTEWPALDAKLLADSAETLNFTLGLPTSLAILPDGTVLFRRTPARSFASDLYAVAPDGTVKTLATVDEMMGSGEEHLSNEEKARRERTRTATRGVVDADVSEDGSKIMVPLGGKLHVIDRATGKRIAIDPKGAAYDPHLSPDGTKIAFVRDGKLVVGTATEPMTVLYTSNPPADHEDGTADFAAQEELDRRRGFWWSPDSKQIAVQRTDNTPIDTLWVSDARHPENAPVKFRYPRAGRPNAKVQLGILTVPAKGAKAEPHWMTWDATYEYLVSVSWKKSAPLTALVLDRDQNNATVLALDGKEPRTLLTEHDDAWIEVKDGGPTWLDDGSGFLWMTEKTGEYTLELHDPKGAFVRTLTPAGFGLRELVAVDGSDAIVNAAVDPTTQEVYRVPLAGGAPTKISAGDGWSTAARAKNGTVVIHTGLVAGGRRVTAVTASGAHELPGVAETPSLVPTTMLETVAIGGNTFHYAITRPRNFDAAKRYPVLLKVYAGPTTITVTNVRNTYVMDQWYADAGFIVVRSDNRGTPMRDRTWQRAVLKDLITIPMNDQVNVLQAIGAKYHELDMSRVGVFGWSFGGYFSTMAVLLRPDVFACAVAGAPVTDWELYDTAYTERFMKLPKDNPEGYKRGNAMTYASTLSRPLLLIHGITDDNVHFAHTLALIEALFVAAKRAEVVTLSGTHMVPDPKLSLAREQIQVDFFREHLAQPAPPLPRPTFP